MAKPQDDEHEKHAPFFITPNKGFSKAVAADDLLHADANAGIHGSSLTETQYFGFNVPEERIHGYMYFWHHPNLGTVSGGVWGWQGIKPHTLSCEMMDQFLFMSDKLLADDLRRYTLENGYSVSILETLKRYHVTYSDPARGNAVDLVYEGLIEPVMFGNGKHFEQPSRVTGTVSLRGKQYAVNCYNFRDRSWGKLRPETNYHLPPVAWHTMAFNDRFFINCTGWDHPDLDPDWKQDFPDFKAEQVLVAGWVHLDGRLTEIVSFGKKTKRNPHTLFPEIIDIVAVDSEGRQFDIKGTVIAASQYATWYNTHAPVCLTRWECRGMTGYGDTQEPQWNDYVYAATKRAQR